MQRVLRLIPTLVAALLLGTMATVLVTWWLAIQFRQVRLNGPGGGFWEFCSTVEGFECSPTVTGPPRWEWWVSSRKWPTEDFHSFPRAPAWLNVPGHGTPATVESTAFGWPLPCLHHLGSGPNPDKLTHDGIIIERGKESYCLPLHPCGWSFVACLRLYSVPFFAAIHLAIPIRNRLRRRRGLCPHCRYDRRGLPPGSACPECGRGASTPVR